MNWHTLIPLGTAAGSAPGGGGDDLKTYYSDMQNIDTQMAFNRLPGYFF